MRRKKLLMVHMYRHVVTHQPRANVLVQRTRRTNAFAATRGDTTAMLPFAKSLRTLIYFLEEEGHCRRRGYYATLPAGRAWMRPIVTDDSRLSVYVCVCLPGSRMNC